MAYKKVIIYNTNKKPRHRNRKPDAYCSNTILHGNRPYPLYEPRIYRWNNRPMCKRCYEHYCANIRLDRR